MRLACLADGRETFLAVRHDDQYVDLRAVEPSLPRSLAALLTHLDASNRTLTRIAELAVAHASAPRLAVKDVRYAPLTTDAGKILCLGLNYVNHAAESPYEKPSYPVIFSRFLDSIVGHEEPLIVPPESTQFDWESELAIVIGKTARRVTRENALDHVAGYSIFNDGSIRDYQMKTPQWTVGKNFDHSGSFGPELVTSDELPPGGRGLRLIGSLNGTVMQEADTGDMIFGVEETISILSQAFTLRVGDVIVMGTPGGVGFARKPPIFMKAGDLFEIAIEKVGTLRNRVAAEMTAR